MFTSKQTKTFINNLLVKNETTVNLVYCGKYGKMAQHARIKLASIEIDKINQICRDITDIVLKTGVKLRGPIPLPTKKLKITTRKSPDGEGKASWERYEMRVHKRLIDIGADERTLRLVMRVPIPEGLSIEIEMVDI